MKVKIGDKIYDGEEELVMIILTEADKRNIANMGEKYTKYCQCPDDTPEEEMDRFMEVEG